jgi:peptidyl-prolyl cis-trans isomerase SurA
MINRIITSFLLLVVLSLNAQHKKDKELLTIEGKPIYASEFLLVYNKNKEIVSQENKKDINEYLELFINYKLKLLEAYGKRLDTVPSYIKEFKKYKKQLIEPFLKDRKVTDQLVREAYDRMLVEVSASHVLIKVDAQASPKDTLEAYNKILNARKKIIDGANFGLIAKQFSDDPSAKKNDGNLGYFTAFSMVYPFETAAYNTKVGDISKPIKSKFGYHIIKVNDRRPSQGEVKAAHIMIKQDKKDKNHAESQINDIYKKLEQGEKFEFLATKHSDDKSSARRGGALKKFSRSKMIQPFADESFNLKKPNDYSKPFQTKYGWHIVKLIEKYPIASFEEQKEALTSKIEKADRSEIVGKSIVNKLKKQYNIKVDQSVLAKVLDLKNDFGKTNPTFLTFKKLEFKVEDLKEYLKNNKSKNYNDFVDHEVLHYYKDNLENENQDYANTLKEYKEGLLLFDLLQENIWTKAEKDTIGLQGFFDNNKSNYSWKKRVHVEIASCTKLEKAKLVQKYLNEGKATDQIKELVNEGPTINVLFNNGTYELTSSKLPENFEVNKGVSEIITEDDKHFTVVNVLEILPITGKKLNEARGLVISDYQNYLEEQWIIKLRKTYSVKVNKKTFKKLKRKYQ